MQLDPRHAPRLRRRETVASMRRPVKRSRPVTSSPPPSSAGSSCSRRDSWIRRATQFNASLRITPGFAPAAFYLGAFHAAGGRDRAAAVLWQQAVAGEGQTPLAYRLLGDALLRLGDAALALDPLREALDTAPMMIRSGGGWRSPTP